MTKFLVLWEMDTSRLPEDPKEWAKRATVLVNMVKADFKSDKTLDWGMFAGGELGGYAIYEGSELELTMENMKYAPFIKFKTYPILAVSHVEEMIAKSRDWKHLQLEIG